MLRRVARGRARRARRCSPAASAPTGRGFFMAPTLIEGADDADRRTELFGPITTLHRVAGFDEARRARQRLALRADRGDLDRSRAPRAGVRRAHRERRGVGQRADLRLGAAHAVRRPAATPARAGARPGTEALDVYSDLKTVYVNHDPAGCRCRAPSPSSRRAAGSERVPGQERRAARRPPADRLLDRRGARRAGCSTPSSSRPTREEIAESRAATAPRCPGCARRRSPAPRRPTSSGCATRSTARDCERRSRILRPTQPVPHARRRSARAWDALHGGAGRRLAPRRAAGARAPGQDVACSTGDVMDRCSPQTPGEVPTHSRQTAALPRSTCRTPRWRSPGRGSWPTARSPAGASSRSSAEGHEGFSIDYPDDLERGRGARRRASRRCCRRGGAA